MLVAVTIASAACSGGGVSVPAGPGTRPGPRTEGSRPASVPPAARFVADDTAFGAEGRTDDGRLFFSTCCTDCILTIVTTKETIYAELPCDRALPQAAAARFLGQPVRARVAVSEPAKLFMQSTSAGSVEFTIGRAWVAE